MAEFAKCYDRKCKHWPRDHAHPIRNAVTFAAERRSQLRQQAADHFRSHRTGVILALCGTGMAYNEVEVVLDIVETGII